MPLPFLKDGHVNFLNKISSSYKSWKEKRFLKKHNVETWEQYHRQYDPDRNIRASKVTDYYHGYKYVIQFTTSRSDPFTRYNTWIEALDGMCAWCKANCNDKWRNDIMRVYKQTALGWDGDSEEEWWINDIGGGDVLFFAFKDEQDAFLFKLTWGCN